jgi:tRNA G18 (ribose-2'-O)-methylase SpoU
MSGETEEVSDMSIFKLKTMHLFVGSEENGLSSEVQKKLDLIVTYQYG